jgi:hypothetical protein
VRVVDTSDIKLSKPASGTDDEPVKVKEAVLCT